MLANGGGPPNGRFRASAIHRAKTSQSINGLYTGTYGCFLKAGKMPLTSPPARPKLQSQTGFGGCDTVESDSPIKRNPWSARGLTAGRTMLIRKNEHFLLLRSVAAQ
jgi:hypothetical protein